MFRNHLLAMLVFLCAASLSDVAFADDEGNTHPCACCGAEGVPEGTLLCYDCGLIGLCLNPQCGNKCKMHHHPKCDCCSVENTPPVHGLCNFCSHTQECPAKEGKCIEHCKCGYCDNWPSCHAIVHGGGLCTKCSGGGGGGGGGGDDDYGYGEGDDGDYDVPNVVIPGNGEDDDYVPPVPEGVTKYVSLVLWPLYNDERYEAEPEQTAHLVIPEDSDDDNGNGIIDKDEDDHNKCPSYYKDGALALDDELIRVAINAEYDEEHEDPPTITIQRKDKRIKLWLIRDHTTHNRFDLFGNADTINKSYSEYETWGCNLFIQGMGISQSSLDEYLEVSLGSDSKAKAEFTIYGCDLDVDSDNDGTIDMANAGEDAHEAHLPGKIVCQNLEGDGPGFDDIVPLRVTVFEGPNGGSLTLLCRSGIAAYQSA